MHFILSILIVSTLSLHGCTGTTSVDHLKVNRTNANLPFSPVPAGLSVAEEAPRISLAEAKKDFDTDSATIIDARPESAYRQEHIKGAINIPLGDFEALYQKIPTNRKIIAYCSCPDEHTSLGLVQKLKEKGIGSAYALLGGTKAWQEAGYPMEKSN